MPRRTATAAASARALTPSLAKRLATWVCTVRVPMKSASAISRSECPSTSKRKHVEFPLSQPEMRLRGARVVAAPRRMRRWRGRRRARRRTGAPPLVPGGGECWLGKRGARLSGDTLGVRRVGDPADAAGLTFGLHRAQQADRPLRLPERQGDAGQTRHRTDEDALGADLRRHGDALGEEAGGQNLVALHPRGVGAFAEGQRNAQWELDTAVEREGLIEQRHGGRHVAGHESGVAELGERQGLPGCHPRRPQQRHRLLIGHRCSRRVARERPGQADGVMGATEGVRVAKLTGERQPFLGIGDGGRRVAEEAGRRGSNVECRHADGSGSVGGGAESRLQPAADLGVVGPDGPVPVDRRQQPEHVDGLACRLEPGKGGTQVVQFGVQTGQPGSLGSARLKIEPGRLRQCQAPGWRGAPGSRLPRRSPPTAQARTRAPSPA